MYEKPISINTAIPPLVAKRFFLIPNHAHAFLPNSKIIKTTDHLCSIFKLTFHYYERRSCGLVAFI